jgi:hypothetical protein
MVNAASSKGFRELRLWKTGTKKMQEIAQTAARLSFYDGKLRAAEFRAATLSF